MRRSRAASWRSGSRREAGREAALIVLTDGRNNPEPVASAIAAAFVPCPRAANWPYRP